MRLPDDTHIVEKPEEREKIDHYKGLKSGSAKRFGSAEVKLQLQFGPPMLPELQIMLDLKITFLVLFSCTSYVNKRFESCL